MNTKSLILLCAAFPLLAACGRRDQDPGMHPEGPAKPAQDNTASPPDTATTPGGNAGDGAPGTGGAIPDNTDVPPSNPPPNNQ
jgi:hypothetical protein